MFRLKAIAYGNRLSDVEVAMLSKNCTAVRSYLAHEMKRIKNNKEWRKSAVDTKPIIYRKMNNPKLPTLGETRDTLDIESNISTVT